MIKLISFDIEGTLAQHDVPVSDEVVQFLRNVEAVGVKIVLNSGASIEYMNGFARQIGLSAPILCGEFGAFIKYGISLPPSKEMSLVADDWKGDVFDDLKASLKKRFDEGIWFHTKKVVITACLKTNEARHESAEFARNYLDEHYPDVSCTVRSSFDSMDVIPACISKGIALAKVMEIEGIMRVETVAVGDGKSDIGVFNVAGTQVGIGDIDVQHKFATIHDALPFLRGVVALGATSGIHL